MCVCGFRKMLGVLLVVGCISLQCYGVFPPETLKENFYLHVKPGSHPNDIEKRMLDKRNVPYETEEEVRAALKHKSMVVRYIALYILVSRIGEDSVPTLLEMLEDTAPRVRKVSACCLAGFGNSSGYAVICKDYDELAKLNQKQLDKLDVDPPQKIKSYYTFDLLHLANWLSYFGDLRGYAIAMKILFSNQGRYERELALQTLAIMHSQSSSERFVKEKTEIESTYLLLAETEKSTVVLDELCSTALFQNSFKELREALLDRLSKSAYLSTETREKVIRHQKRKASQEEGT